MPRWLFKQEPTCYSYADLEREGTTTWDGVNNPLALIHLRNARVGDPVLFYHTGKEKAVVGVMKVAAVGEADGKPVVTVAAVRRLANPVPLAAIKADPAFADWDLLRISRLSVVPVPDAMWKRIEELAKGPPAQGPKRKKTAG